MQLTVDKKIVSVRLSRRNLEHLIQMLDHRVDTSLHRICENGITLHVFPEENEDHYGDRPAGPGYDPRA